MTENVQGFPPIQKRVMEFVQHRFHPGYNRYNVSKLLGDASSRQYYRYVAASGDSFILAAYPEPFQPDVFPYRQIYALFQEIGVEVPEIIQLDGELGIVLQQDLGDKSLHKHLMGAAPHERLEILQQAIDHIVQIQEGSPRFTEDFANYTLALDTERLEWELRFFLRNYLETYRRRQIDDAARLQQEFLQLANELGAGPHILCHRDYHVRNLMVTNDRLYVIDFQDARWGPISYDLVSLLKDSVELLKAEIIELIAYYLDRARATFGSDRLLVDALKPDLFIRQFHLMSIQRLLKALGTYAYQIRYRENFIYEQYMSGSLHRTLLSLQALGEFPYIQSLIEDELK